MCRGSCFSGLLHLWHAPLPHLRAPNCFLKVCIFTHGVCVCARVHMYVCVCVYVCVCKSTCARDEYVDTNQSKYTRALEACRAMSIADLPDPTTTTCLPSATAASVYSKQCITLPYTLHARTYTHINTHTQTHTLTHTQTQVKSFGPYRCKKLFGFGLWRCLSTHSHARIHIHAYTQTDAHICVCVDIYTYQYIYICVYKYICTYIYIHICV